MLTFYTGEWMDFLGTFIGLVILEVALHAGNHLFGHQIRPPLGIPAISAGNILIRFRNLDHAGDLRIEGIFVFILLPICTLKPAMIRTSRCCFTVSIRSTDGRNGTARKCSMPS